MDPILDKLRFSDAYDRWESVLSRERELVAAVGRPSSFEDDLSVFPPSNHEGLHVDLTISSSNLKEATISAECAVEHSKMPVAISSLFSKWRNRYRILRTLRVADWRRIAVSGVGVMRSGVSWARGRIGCERCLQVEWGSFWCLLAMTAMAIWLACVRRWNRQEKLRLLLLIQEKDRMIGRLLHELAQKN